MATKFIEPGGDADFGRKLWNSNNGAPTAVSDFVHGGHQRSMSCGINNTNQLRQSTLADAGRRISFYLYINALPTATASISELMTNAASVVAGIRLTSAGVLQLWNARTGQIGSSGPTLATGTWYRISLAYTITSTTVNQFRLFVNGTLAISVSNATLTTVVTNIWAIGAGVADTTFDFRTSDHYVDDSSALTDPGNIWVTAKRPVANGSSNQWTTQIGSGGSGYGTGHSSQVNERPLSTTNGWSIQNAAKQTEEYTIEAKNVGDIDITQSTIVDFAGWVHTAVGVASTGNIIVAGVATNISVPVSANTFLQLAGSTTYPAGNTDIGMDTNTVNQLFSLYECGIVVAFIPFLPPNKVVEINQSINRANTY